jgi:hypothetical protein
MGGTPLDHLAEILDEHDGDDRCQCLRDSIWLLIHPEDRDEAVDEVIRVLSKCLAEHPAGLTMRERFNRSVNRSLEG